MAVKNMPANRIHPHNLSADGGESHAAISHIGYPILEAVGPA